MEGRSVTRTGQRTIQNSSEGNRENLQDLGILARQRKFHFLCLGGHAHTLLTRKSSVLGAICGAL